MHNTALSLAEPGRGRRRRPGGEPQQEAFSRAQWLWLLGATAVAAVLRFTDLGTWSFWIDEAHTWRDATMPMRGENGWLHESRALYPLTFLGLRGLLGLGWVGPDEFSLRLPFAVIGVLSVPVLAVCGRRFVGATAAVFAAWLWAVNSWHIYWSQNARGYILVCLLAPIAVERTQQWLETGRNRDLFAALLAVLIGTMSHPTAALWGLGMLAFFAMRRMQGWSLRPKVVTGVVTLVMSGLVPIAGTEWLFPDFARSKNDPSAIHFLQTAAYYYRPVLLVLASVGVWWLHRSGRRRLSLLLGSFAFVPFYVMFVVGFEVKITARYSICAFPVLVWLAAHACVQFARTVSGAVGAALPARRLLAALLPGILVADFASHTWSYFEVQQGQRAQWREACAAALRSAGKRPLRVLTKSDPIAIFYLTPYFYRDPTVPGDDQLQVWPLTKWGIEGGKIDEPKVHAPGGANHLHWHEQWAKTHDAQLVVLVTRPELDEIDPDGQVWQTLLHEFDLLAHLPCFVGPKDESLYAFVPRPE